MENSDINSGKSGINQQQWEYDGDLVGGSEHDWIMTFHSAGNGIIPTDERIYVSEGLFYHQPGIKLSPQRMYLSAGEIPLVA